MTDPILDAGRQIVLLDCGAHDLSTLPELLKDIPILPTIIEIYEPNPEFELEKNLESIRKYIHESTHVDLFSDAIWTYDGTVKFSQEFQSNRHNTPPDIQPQFAIDKPATSEASAITSTLPSNLEDDVCHRFSFADPIDVNCVDLSRIIKKHKDDYEVVIKMDIEGAEYDVLRHLIREGTAQYINTLFIEWHFSSMSNETEESSDRIIEKLTEAGVSVREWY